MTQRIDRDRERAKLAWSCIQKVQSEKTEYRGLARSFPSMVQFNGLGPACAFLNAKAKNGDAADKAAKKDEKAAARANAYGMLLNHVACALQTGKIFSIDQRPSNQQIMQWIGEAKQEDYRRATTEVMAFLLWLRRFAEGELPAKQEKDQPEPAQA
jgi:CRISPR-associated protein Cmr5